jgi:hypothetical protein
MPPIHQHVQLTLHLCLLLRPFVAPLLLSTLAGCCVASHHATASCQPAPPPLIALLSLIVPLSRLLSGWMSRHLSSHRCLPSACPSASKRTPTYYCAPLTPLVRLVVASLLITLPPPIHLRLHLSSCPSRALVRLVVASPLVMPPLPLVACASASHCAIASHCDPLVPLFCLVVTSPLVMPPPLVHLPSASHRTAASHCSLLVPLVWLVVASPLVTPPSPVSLRLCLSAHCRLSSRPSCNRVYNARPATISSTSFSGHLS